MNEFKKHKFNWRDYSVRDWSWVLQIFFCGKVLRRKNYRPKDAGDQMSIFQGLPKMTGRRMVLLLKLWGLRPLTLDEFTAIKEHYPRPNLDWLKQDDNWGDHNHCFRVRM